MPVCLACGTWGKGDGRLCTPCRDSLVRAPWTRLPSGLLVGGAFLHQGAARRLVHRLKYGGLLRVAELFGEVLAPLVPPTATALVPVPRAWVRRATHGVDPAQVLARAVAARCNLPVISALRPGLWWPRHAGRDRAGRTGARYRAARRLAPGAVLVDDVLTTGATLEAATAALAGIPAAALTATVASRVRRGPPNRPSELLETVWRHHWGEGGDPCATSPTTCHTVATPVVPSSRLTQTSTRPCR